MVYEQKQESTNIGKLLVIVIGMHSLIYVGASIFFYNIIFSSAIENNLYYIKEFGLFTTTYLVACLFIGSLRSITIKQIIYYFVIPLFLLLICTISLIAYIIYISNIEINIIGSSLFFALISLLIIWASSIMIEN